jgi:hypothetical protein
MTEFPSRSWVWFVLALLAAASMEFYTVRIWSANQPAGFTDLYAPWWGAHELLRGGRDPYSPAVAHEIQKVIYGAPALPWVDDPGGIAGGYSYPAYAAFLLWPLVYLPFAGAQVTFLVASILFTTLSVALWLRMFRFRLSTLEWLTVALFALGSFPALEAFKLENLSVMAAALLALAVYLLSTERFIPAGALLALATFKPQFTVVLIPWLAVWTLSEWRRRQALAWSFLGTMILLVLSSEWLTPGWISEFLRVARAYRRYTYGHSLLDVWFTPKFGLAAAGALVAATLALCWPSRKEAAGSPRFLLVISLVLAATLVVIPTLAPHAQLLLLPGFLCLLRERATLWQGSISRPLFMAAWALLAWPWIAAVGLMVASFWLPVARLAGLWQVPLYTSPLLPLAGALALWGALRGGSVSMAGPAAASGQA